MKNSVSSRATTSSGAQTPVGYKTGLRTRPSVTSKASAHVFDAAVKGAAIALNDRRSKYVTTGKGATSGAEI